MRGRGGGGIRGFAVRIEKKYHPEREGLVRLVDEGRND